MREYPLHIAKAALLGALIGGVAGIIIGEFTLHSAGLGALVGAFFGFRAHRHSPSACEAGAAFGHQVDSHEGQ